MANEIDPDIVDKLARELADKLDGVRTEVRDQWWRDEVLDITGYRFINCRFDNCVLVFDWPHFELIGCTMPGTDILPKRTHEKRQSSTSSPSGS